MRLLSSQLDVGAYVFVAMSHGLKSHIESSSKINRVPKAIQGDLWEIHVDAGPQLDHVCTVGVAEVYSFLSGVRTAKGTSNVASESRRLTLIGSRAWSGENSFSVEDESW